MNRDDLADFLGLIDSYSPGFASKDRQRALAGVWFHQMQEIPAGIATEAVHAHYAAETRWVMPADVRRYAAIRAGVLPPDPAEALAQARAWSDWRGPASSPWPTSGEPQIHPAARAAARALGWNWLDATPDRYARGAWREAYEKAAEDSTRRALVPGGILTVRAEIAAPAPRPALPAAPPPVDEPNEDAGPAPTPDELHRQIARVVVAKAAPPRADYAPPTDIERARWGAALLEWATQNGYEMTGGQGA